MNAYNQDEEDQEDHKQNSDEKSLQKTPCSNQNSKEDDIKNSDKTHIKKEIFLWEKNQQMQKVNETIKNQNCQDIEDDQEEEKFYTISDQQSQQYEQNSNNNSSSNNKKSNSIIKGSQDIEIQESSLIELDAEWARKFKNQLDPKEQKQLRKYVRKYFKIHFTFSSFIYQISSIYGEFKSNSELYSLKIDSFGFFTVFDLKKGNVIQKMSLLKPEQRIEGLYHLTVMKIEGQQIIVIISRDNQKILQFNMVEDDIQQFIQYNIITDQGYIQLWYKAKLNPLHQLQNQINAPSFDILKKFYCNGNEIFKEEIRMNYQIKFQGLFSKNHKFQLIKQENYPYILITEYNNKNNIKWSLDQIVDINQQPEFNKQDIFEDIDIYYDPFQNKVIFELQDQNKGKKIQVLKTPIQKPKYNSLYLKIDDEGQIQIIDKCLLAQQLSNIIWTNNQISKVYKMLANISYYCEPVLIYLFLLENVLNIILMIIYAIDGLWTYFVILFLVVLLDRVNQYISDKQNYANKQELKRVLVFFDIFTKNPYRFNFKVKYRIFLSLPILILNLNAMFYVSSNSDHPVNPVYIISYLLSALITIIVTINSKLSKNNDFIQIYSIRDDKGKFMVIQTILIYLQIFVFIITSTYSLALFSDQTRKLGILYIFLVLYIPNILYSLLVNHYMKELEQGILEILVFVTKLTIFQLFSLYNEEEEYLTKKYRPFYCLFVKFMRVIISLTFLIFYLADKNNQPSYSFNFLVIIYFIYCILDFSKQTYFQIIKQKSKQQQQLSQSNVSKSNVNPK